MKAEGRHGHSKEAGRLQGDLRACRQGDKGCSVRQADSVPVPQSTGPLQSWGVQGTKHILSLKTRQTLTTASPSQKGLKGLLSVLSSGSRQPAPSLMLRKAAQEVLPVSPPPLAPRFSICLSFLSALLLPNTSKLMYSASP